MASTDPCSVVVSGKVETAKFHRWADKVIYDDSNQPHDVTYGIVELSTGKIIHAEPQTITLL